jgi:hypothetical protein
MKKRDHDIQNELEEQAPRLARLRRQEAGDGFTAPPGYFQHLPDDVLERIRREEAAPVRLLSLRRRRLLRAAAVALLIAAGAYWWWEVSPEKETPATATLTADEISAYVSANLDAFDEELVLEAATGEGELLLLLPNPGGDAESLDDYYDELIRELDEESLEELL